MTWWLIMIIAIGVIVLLSLVVFVFAALLLNGKIEREAEEKQKYSSRGKEDIDG